MGTLNYTLGKYAGARTQNVMGTEIETSDAFTTSTSAANVEDGSGDISAAPGYIFRAVTDEPAWIAFGGRTATVGNDFHMLAGVIYTWEISARDAGTISVIDVS